MLPIGVKASVFYSFPQAKNGMFIRMALILKMLEVTV